MLPPIVEDFIQKSRTDNEYRGRVKEIAEACAKSLGMVLIRPEALEIKPTQPKRRLRDR